MSTDNPNTIIKEGLNDAAAPSALQSGTKNWLEGLDNPYFQAGFGLMGVGVVFGGLRKFTTFADVFLRRRLIKLTNLSGVYRNGSSSVFFNLVAGTGMHWLKYRGVWMQVVRERDTQSMQMMSGNPWETVTLTTLSRDRDIFLRLLAEARDLAMRDQEGKLVIQTPWGTEWRPFGLPRRKRPLHSVVLDNGIAAAIENDVQSFLNRRQWYVDRGIPYRRGFLLHGPPGSGKSSYIQALAGSLNYNLCLLNLSERGLGDDKLTHLLSTVPEQSIVLIEDVDAAFNKRVQTSEDG
ncbi:mitochondrial chaperone bcs1 [Lentinula edodes]|uniref:Mitochondrial chaperone bcs1 n=1 Tax=Lentinula edodes TaxID=5353 RepID=A0A1Q3E1W4_LENED|nr:mitochondrial chaperone bcs1 [Lentinula edodes]